MYAMVSKLKEKKTLKDSAEFLPEENRVSFHLRKKEKYEQTRKDQPEYRTHIHTPQS